MEYGAITEMAMPTHGHTPEAECRTFAVVLMLLRPMMQQLALSQLHLGREETRRQVQEEARARE